MIHYKVEELDASEQTNIQKDDYIYKELKVCYQNLSAKLINDAYVSKIILKCDSKVDLINMTLTLKKEFENDLISKQINIPPPQPQIKQGFGDIMLYQIYINETQKVKLVKLSLKDNTGNMKIYFLGIYKGDQLKFTNKVSNQQGDIRQFFDNVSHGKTIQRKDNPVSRSFEHNQTDYTSQQQFGLRNNFSQHKSNTDIIHDFGTMSLEEKNLQRLALEKFQAEKNKQANKPQEKQQTQRYEQKILITDKRDANFHLKNKQPQKDDVDDQNRYNYIGQLKTSVTTVGGRQQQWKKQEQDNKKVQIDLGYNDPQKQQEKRNYSKESNKSKPENEKPIKIDIFNPALMTVYGYQDLSSEVKQYIEKQKGGVKKQLYLIQRAKQMHDQEWAKTLNNKEMDYQQNKIK